MLNDYDLPFLFDDFYPVLIE